ncbi:hypothetical protein BKA61DRAFT_283800, partial [Leptodontidium sp. MPI-SDFR-AT-0119]
MDPISALGAAGSVVGIAGFGLQLSKVLYQFTTEALSAPESLRTILNGIRATTCALELVHDFLKEECKHLEQKGQALLFSPKAITDVKRTADGCLMIFWRIEATITCKAGPKFESILAQRLDLFNAELCKEDREPVVPDPELSKLTTWRRLRWGYIAPKLDQFNNQLQLLQTNLVLMFQVVSLGAHRMRPNQKEQDLRALLDWYTRIQRMAQHADLSQIGPNQSAGENLAGFARRRLESPIGAREGLHPFIPQGDPLRRHSLSPRRRHLSPVRVGAAKRDKSTDSLPPQAAGGSTREIEPESLRRFSDLKEIPRKSRKGKEKAKVEAEVPVAPDLQDIANGDSSLEMPANGRTFGLVDENDATTSSKPIEKRLGSTVSGDGWSQDITKNSIVTKNQENAGLKDTSQSDDKVPGVVNTPEPTPASNPGKDVIQGPVRGPPTEQRLHLSSDNSGQTGAIETPSGGSLLQTPQQVSEPTSVPSIDIPTIVEHLTTPNSTVNVGDGLANEANEGFFRREPENLSQDPSASVTQYSNDAQAHSRDKMTSTMQNELNSMPRSQENSQDVDAFSDASRTRNRTTRNRSSIGPRQSLYAPSSSQSSRNLEESSESRDFLSRLKTILNSGRSVPDPFISAYFIKNGEAHQVPHSGYLKLTQSLKRSIETQSTEQSWHKTFAFMDPDDLGALQEVIEGGGIELNRKIVDLKKIRENRVKFWKSGIHVHFAVIRDFPPEAPSIASSSRSLIETQESQTGNLSNYRRGRRLNAERRYPWIAQDPSRHRTKGQAPQNMESHQIATAVLENLPQAHVSPQPPTSNQWHHDTLQTSLPTSGPRLTPQPPPHPPPNPPPVPRYIPPQAPGVPGGGPWGHQPESTPLRRPLQQSVRIQDISPPKIMNEEMCLKRLTTYSMYTIYRASTGEIFDDLSTWARAEVIEEQLSQLDIVTQIDKLHQASLPVLEKKAALSRDQQTQITTLLDDLASREMDQNFCWVLAQLDTKSAVVEGKRKKMTFEDITILVFVRRAPIPNANPIMLYQAIERMKAARFQAPRPPQPPAPQGLGHSQGGRRPPPPPPPPPGGPPQQKPVPILQQQRGGSSKGKTVSMSKPISSVFKKSKKQRREDSSDCYDSDSDDSSNTSSTSSTSMTARPGRSRHRRGRRNESDRTKGSGRRSSRRSRDRSSSPRSNQNSKMGSVQPHPSGTDPITAAYYAGKEDVLAERSANSYGSQYPSQPQSSARYNHPYNSFRTDQYI